MIKIMRRDFNVNYRLYIMFVVFPYAFLCGTPDKGMAVLRVAYTDTFSKIHEEVSVFSVLHICSGTYKQASNLL
jgi:hypothetical protein